MFVEWCTICQAAPSDGRLTIEIENGDQLEIEACQNCVNDPEKVEFI